MDQNSYLQMSLRKHLHIIHASLKADISKYFNLRSYSFTIHSSCIVHVYNIYVLPRSMTSVKGTTHVDLLDVRRKMHRSAESLPVEIQRGKGGALNTRGRKRNHVSMELAKRMSQKGSVLQKWRSTAGSCSNILFNTVNNDLNRNTQPTSTKSSRSMKYNCNYL